MMFYGPFGWYGLGWAIQAIVGIVVFFFFLWIILHVVRSFGWRTYHHYRRWWYADEDALEILRKRYARGEISKEEYEKMKEDLRKDER